MLKRKNLLKLTALIILAGLPGVVASVPRDRSISDDVAIYQNLREIKITKAKFINFDRDLAKLSAQEKKHRKPISLRLSQPMERVDKTPYRRK